MTLQVKTKRDGNGEKRFYFGNRVSLEAEGFPGYTRDEINQRLAEINARLDAGRIDAIYRRMRGGAS